MEKENEGDRRNRENMWNRTGIREEKKKWKVKSLRERWKKAINKPKGYNESWNQNNRQMKVFLTGYSKLLSTFREEVPFSGENLR